MNFIEFKDGSLFFPSVTYARLIKNSAEEDYTSGRKKAI